MDKFLNQSVPMFDYYVVADVTAQGCSTVTTVNGAAALKHKFAGVKAESDQGAFMWDSLQPFNTFDWFISDEQTSVINQMAKALSDPDAVVVADLRAPAAKKSEKSAEMGGGASNAFRLFCPK